MYPTSRHVKYSQYRQTLNRWCAEVCIFHYFCVHRQDYKSMLSTEIMQSNFSNLWLNYYCFLRCLTGCSIKTQFWHLPFQLNRYNLEYELRGIMYWHWTECFGHTENMSLEPNWHWKYGKVPLSFPCKQRCSYMMTRVLYFDMNNWQSIKWMYSPCIRSREHVSLATSV